MSTEKKKPPSPRKLACLEPVSWLLEPGSDVLKGTGRQLHLATDVFKSSSNNTNKVHALAGEDGRIDVYHSGAFLTIQFGEDWKRGREMAQALLEVLEDESDFPTVEKYIKDHPVDAHTLIHLLWMIRQQGISRNTKHAAQANSAKSADAKEWVRLQWEHRKDKTVTKKAFAESKVQAVFEQYDVEVSSRHIVERWLRGLQ
jgi:hypothetical protein